MRPNRLRELLKAGKPTLGMHLIGPWPGMVEVVGQSGAFDYIEYVGEYSPFSLEGMDDICRAIELFPNFSGMMKVEENGRGFIAPRAIDAGFQSVLFTDIRTVNDVKDCIRAVRSERPDAGGVHGFGMRRSVGYVVGSCDEWAKAMDDIVIAIMIEKTGAMDNLEKILAVPGLDMVQFGPSDYSISYGKPGQSKLPEIQGAYMKMIEMALKKGVAPRVEVGSFEQAKPFVDMGVKHFCIGWDVGIMYAWCNQNGEGMRKLLGIEPPNKTEKKEGGYAAMR
jgi:2-keto-3-deoxy-L-rhamnonate aldolase RhmA